MPVDITYTAAISACAKDEQWQQAHGLPAMRTADLMPVVITCAAAISTCAKDVQWQQAVGLLAMQTGKLMPVVITLTAAISADTIDDNASYDADYLAYVIKYGTVHGLLVHNSGTGKTARTRGTRSCQHSSRRTGCRASSQALFPASSMTHTGHTSLTTGRCCFMCDALTAVIVAVHVYVYFDSQHSFFRTS
jgi:hypothetical protein